MLIAHCPRTLPHVRCTLAVLVELYHSPTRIAATLPVCFIPPCICPLLSCTLTVTIAECYGIERGKYARFRSSESRWLVRTGVWVRGSSLASRDRETTGYARACVAVAGCSRYRTGVCWHPLRLASRGVRRNKVVPRRSHCASPFALVGAKGIFVVRRRSGSCVPSVTGSIS